MFELKKKYLKFKYNPEAFFIDSKLYLLRRIGNIASYYHRHRSSLAYRKEELVSVIMPVYNCADTVKESIESLIRQTHKKIEIIIVDDASSDSTLSIIKEISKRDSRLRVYRSCRNLGPYCCRNFGLEVAKGEVITFQDADDVSRENRLETQLGFLLRNKKNNIACVCDRHHYDQDMVPLTVNGRKKSMAVNTIMFFKNPVVDELGYFDSVRFAADLEYMDRMKCYYGKDKVLRINAPLLKYRHSTKSVTHKGPGAHRWDVGVSLVRTEQSGVRRRYHENSECWHLKIKNGGAEPFMPASVKIKDRSFLAENSMCVEYKPEYISKVFT